MPLLPGAHCTVMHFLSGPDFRVSDSILTKAKVQKTRKFFFLTPILLYDVCTLAYFDLKIKLLTGELHSDEFHQFFCAVMIFVMMLYLLHKVYKIYRLIW